MRLLSTFDERRELNDTAVKILLFHITFDLNDDNLHFRFFCGGGFFFSSLFAVRAFIGGLRRDSDLFVHADFSRTCASLDECAERLCMRKAVERLLV